MRKSLIISLVCLILFPFLFRFPAKALDMYQLDQEQTSFIGGVSVYTEYYRNQTFKVTKGVLTRIDVGMMDRKSGANIILVIQDETTGQNVWTTNHRMDAGDGWETFELTPNDLGLLMDTTHLYSMWIGTSYYAVDPPAWQYTTNSSSYTLGTRRDGQVEYPGDMVFRTYGYDIDMGRENPDNPPVVPEEEEEIPEYDGKDEPATEDKAVVPDKPISATDIDEEDIDEEVIVPALEFVIVDDVIVDSQGEDGLDVGVESIIKIAGTAGAGDTVYITIGDKAYSAKADDDGNWYVIVSATDIAEGSYDVIAQSKNDDGKASTKATLFKLNVLGEDVVPIAEEETDIFTYGIYVLSGILLLGLIFLVIFFIKRKKKEEKKEDIKVEMPKEDKI
ncbi:MAG: hypothetical protein PHE21_02435 [Candidatus Dojkabacteria bacterium]|nr:hypothetical protein [Candidatus Dojkabacteria bacterium]